MLAVMCVPYFGSMRSRPFMYGRSASGSTTEPSA